MTENSNKGFTILFGTLKQAKRVFVNAAERIPQVGKFIILTAASVAVFTAALTHIISSPNGFFGNMSEWRRDLVRNEQAYADRLRKNIEESPATQTQNDTPVADAASKEKPAKWRIYGGGP